MIINLDIPEDIEQDAEGLDTAAVYRKLMEITAIEFYVSLRANVAFCFSISRSTVRSSAVICKM